MPSYDELDTYEEKVEWLVERWSTVDLAEEVVALRTLNAKLQKDLKDARNMQKV